MVDAALRYVGWHLRQPLAPPAWDTLPPAVQQRFRLIDGSVRAAAARSAILPAAGLLAELPPPLQPVPRIHHPLTNRFPPVRKPIPLAAAQRERQVAIAAGDVVAAIRRRGALGVARELAVMFDPGIGVRTGTIATGPDRHGRHVVFPPADLIQDQFARIDALIASGAPDGPPAFRALVTLALVTNCHAFTDGNGRVARLLFHAVLREGAEAGVFYLPLREIAVFARGGFIIRLREAEIHDRWAPLAEFTAAAVALWHRLLVAQPLHAMAAASTRSGAIGAR